MNYLFFISRGKFGKVYRCLNKTDSEPYAVKMYTNVPFSEWAMVEQEISILNEVKHDKLVTLVNVFRAKQNQAYLVFELVQGGELFERVIDEDFELTEDLCRSYMQQICQGVQYLHETLSVIHLDLKPENIVCTDKTGRFVKIIDFGLARKYSAQTPVKMMFGTPEFAAPEVLSFDPVTPASDCWSLGVICYVLLSGISPFQGDTDFSTINNVANGHYDFDDPSFLEISDSAKDFIKGLLIKDGNSRRNVSDCMTHKWILGRSLSDILNMQDAGVDAPEGDVSGTRSSTTFPATVDDAFYSFESQQQKRRSIVIDTTKLRTYLTTKKWRKVSLQIRAIKRLNKLCGLDGSGLNGAVMFLERIQQMATMV